MTQLNNRRGFSTPKVLLVLVVIVALGLVGWLIHRHSQPTTQTKTTENVTSAELISVAKEVYVQQSDTADNLPIVGICGMQDTQACPFTTQLSSHISTVSDGPPTVQTLLAGVQNGPFGTLDYIATPSGQGGAVKVVLNPSSSAGGVAMTWRLTMVRSGAKLLVSDIMYSRGADGSAAACGPVEIYDYASCH